MLSIVGCMTFDIVVYESDMLIQVHVPFEQKEQAQKVVDAFYDR